MQTVGYKEGSTYGGLQRLHSSHYNTTTSKQGRFSTQFSYPSDSPMEAYVQTVSTPPTSEEDQQGTPLTPGTTEYLLPDVDPSLAMKKEVEVKVETSQVVQGVGFVCVLCRKSFTTVEGRNCHVRRCHGGASYTCQTCAKVFNRKDNLNQHIKSVHQGEKPFPCTDCGKDFSQKAHLIQHIRSVHKGEKPHICPECGKSFGDRS